MLANDPDAVLTVTISPERANRVRPLNRAEPRGREAIAKTLCVLLIPPA